MGRLCDVSSATIGRGERVNRCIQYVNQKSIYCASLSRTANSVTALQGNREMYIMLVCDKQLNCNISLKFSEMAYTVDATHVFRLQVICDCHTNCSAKWPGSVLLSCYGVLVYKESINSIGLIVDIAA